MIQISDVRDETSLKEWLQLTRMEWGQPDVEPQENLDSATRKLAVRAAMRVLPRWWGELLESGTEKADAAMLCFFRSCLSAAVAVKTQKHEFAQVASAASNWPNDIFSIAEKSKTNFQFSMAASNAALAAGGDGFEIGASAVIDSTKLRGDNGHLVLDSIRADLRLLQSGGNLVHAPLWETRTSSVDAEWDSVKQRVLGPEWAFWIKWYDDVLAGHPQDWALLEKIALSGSKVWDAGPVAVAEEIKRRRSDPSLQRLPDLDEQITRLPAAPSANVKAVQQAMTRNRSELPPTFDAIESLILLEIERLQSKNYRDDDDKSDALKQIRTYLVLHDAIGRLRGELPASGPVTKFQAENAEKLWRLYAGKFAALPHENVDEMVDGVWATTKGLTKFCLISASAYLATQFGVNANLGFTAGIMCFAPKKAGQILSSALKMVTDGS